MTDDTPHNDVPIEAVRLKADRLFAICGLSADEFRMAAALPDDAFRAWAAHRGQTKFAAISPAPSIAPAANDGAVQ